MIPEPDKSEETRGPGVETDPAWDRYEDDDIEPKTKPETVTEDDAEHGDP